MSQTKLPDSTRRRFITRAIPACAAACFGCGPPRALAQDAVLPEVGHMFDNPLDKELTYRQFYAIRYREYIALAKALGEDLGKEKTIALLEKYTTERMMRFGREQAKRSADNHFSTYVAMFRGSEGYKNTLTKEIVEDTDDAFELKVTECIWASTFIDLDAADIGYAAVCFGDYAWAEGFNPQIKLVRDKTLMEGAPYCNHRYIREPKKT